MSFVLKEVTALFPRLDRTYRFDNGERRSVPCDPTADGAEYSINVEMSPEQGNKLHEYCQAAFEDFAKQNKGAKYLNKPYKKNEQGLVVAKAKLKGAYNGEATKKPRVYGTDNKLIEEPGYQLTTGSTINLAVTAVPYATAMAQGVSLRISAVQVLELAEGGTATSPFEAVESTGFSSASTSLEDDIPF